MDPFLIFLIAVISILTIVLTIVGIQIIILLRKVNKTLGKFNSTLDTAQNLIHNFSNPFSDLKSLGQGVKTGLHVAEYIGTWIKNKQTKEED